MDSEGGEIRQQVAREVKDKQDGKAAKAEGHRQLHFAVSPQTFRMSPSRPARLPTPPGSTSRCWARASGFCGSIPPISHAVNVTEIGAGNFCSLHDANDPLSGRLINNG